MRGQWQGREGRGPAVEQRHRYCGCGACCRQPGIGRIRRRTRCGCRIRPCHTGGCHGAAPRKEGAFGETWRRKTDLEQRLVREARGALQTHRQRCAAEQRDRAARRTQARTNTAVAVSEQAITAEMQAAAAACELRARELQANVDALEKELRELSKK